MSRHEQGSATVELAASIPMLTLFLLLMVQVAVVLLDQLAVTQAAREGARAAAVDPSPGVAAAAAARATGLDPGRLRVQSTPRPGGMVQVTAIYRSRITLPLTGRTLLEPDVDARITMRVEHRG